MSKRKKKQIKERKYAMRMAQKTTETLLSAMAGKPVKLKQNLANRIK